jgi:hypothetical protein
MKQSSPVISVTPSSADYDLQPIQGGAGRAADPFPDRSGRQQPFAATSSSGAAANPSTNP